MLRIIVNNKDLFDSSIDMLNDFRNNISHCFNLFFFFLMVNLNQPTWQKVTRISLGKKFPGGLGH